LLVTEMASGIDSTARLRSAGGDRRLVRPLSRGKRNPKALLMVLRLPLRDGHCDGLRSGAVCRSWIRGVGQGGARFLHLSRFGPGACCLNENKTCSCQRANN